MHKLNNCSVYKSVTQADRKHKITVEYDAIPSNLISFSRCLISNSRLFSRSCSSKILCSSCSCSSSSRFSHSSRRTLHKYYVTLITVVTSKPHAHFCKMCKKNMCIFEAWISAAQEATYIRTKCNSRFVIITYVSCIFIYFAAYSTTLYHRLQQDFSTVMVNYNYSYCK
jgi:hypothetical protein